MCIVLAVMYAVPGDDAGSYENVVDSLHMLACSSQLLAFVVVYLFSISFFNFFGVTMSGKLSAVTRTINDALRTMIIWIVELIVFYGISEKYGQKWLPHSYLQLIGFVFLIAGSMVNSQVLRLPCLTYDEAVPPAWDALKVSLQSRYDKQVHYSKFFASPLTSKLLVTPQSVQWFSSPPSVQVSADALH